MATTKKFAVAGVSTLNGKTKIRFANDVMRIKILAKNGHTDINLVDLPHEMSKGEIAAHMKAVGFGSNSPAVLAAISYIAKKNPVETAGSSATVEKTAAVAA